MCVYICTFGLLTPSLRIDGMASAAPAKKPLLLHCTILYYTILYYTIVYYSILYYSIVYYTITLLIYYIIVI